MTKLKRIILRIALFMLMAMLVCTVLSQTVSRLLTPSVRGMVVREASLTDESIPPGQVVPVNYLYEDKDGTFVFRLLERSTLMGREAYVERVDVRVVGRDHQYALIEYFGNHIRFIAAYPTKALFDGAVVEVRQ